MFYLSISLEYLDLSNFNTEKSEDMSYMFFNCRKLQNLNLTNFSFQLIK